MTAAPSALTFPISHVVITNLIREGVGCVGKECSRENLGTDRHTRADNKPLGLLRPPRAHDWTSAAVHQPKHSAALLSMDVMFNDEQAR